MATATTVVSCKEGEYTALGTAITSLSLRILTMAATTRGRLVFANALPAASAAGYTHVSNRKWKNFGSITDNAYFMPLGSAATVEVIKA